MFYLETVLRSLIPIELNHYEPERMGNIQTPIKRQGSFVGSKIGWLAETLNSAHSLSSGDVGSRGLDLGDDHGAVTAITTEASSDGADRGERAELRGGSKGARGRRGSRRKEMVVRALVELVPFLCPTLSAWLHFPPATSYPAVGSPVI
jgi:hypothetical protein